MSSTGTNPVSGSFSCLHVLSVSHSLTSCFLDMLPVVCVCQLVNARCTAADKDQKDITNNMLLTGERDTQVPQGKHHFIKFIHLPITYCCHIPKSSP